MNDADGRKCRVEGETVRVVYVTRKDAKHVKSKLEKRGLLNKNFRMTPATLEWKNCVAVPVLLLESSSEEISDMEELVGNGSQFCPYSSSVLGNSHRQRTAKCGGPSGTTSLTTIQSALLNAILDFFKETDEETLLAQVVSLDSIICPKNLELFGDDNTLVIPRRALSIEESTFRAFLVKVGVNSESLVNAFMAVLWAILAAMYKSPRIVRKGYIDPDSPVRESGFKLIWLSTIIQSAPHGATGPSSPTWITVTEQGIRQSFDMTRVMFSRGNITEKIRFGKMVRNGEIVLDMYAGIGYFTLPALVCGRAAHVYACEWNDHAVEALRYNLEQNQVADRATVFVGDCRVVARDHNLRDMCDRVSLGLLPSSEGGWETAVRALRRNSGGWLHVHGNVPMKEAQSWCKWLCIRLRTYVKMEGLSDQWVIVASHLEKVKSFAPTVNHYVADVYLGPVNNFPSGGLSLEPGSAVCLRQMCPETMEPPSCALSPSGVLNQAWMR